jgi:hypothetical protein
LAAQEGGIGGGVEMIGKAQRGQQRTRIVRRMGKPPGARQLRGQE